MLNKYAMLKEQHSPNLTAAVERLFGVSAGTNLDVQKKPAIRQQLGKTVQLLLKANKWNEI